MAEIKVGQKYVHAGKNWGDTEGTLIRVTSVSEVRIGTDPGSWDIRDLFFPTKADFISSGKVMGYVLVEDVPEESVSFDPVEKPAHYNQGKFEVIDVIEDWGLHKNYFLGNVIKYVARSSHKGNEAEDLKKARFYLNRYIDSLES